MELDKLLESLILDSKGWMKDSEKRDDWNDFYFHKGQMQMAIRIQTFIKNEKTRKQQEVSRVSIHKNYNAISDEEKVHVDRMYDLINKYSKEHGLKLAYNDTAEKFVEAIATYLVDSKS